jgi:hypothetical protein
VTAELIVYVFLPDEAVDVWRPAAARHLRDDLYVLCGPIPEDEVWEFQPGEVVRCEERGFAGGARGLTAVARAGEGGDTQR